MMFFLILFGVPAAYFNFEYFLCTNGKYRSITTEDTIVLHFIHGSIPKKNCEDQRIRVGGLLGGHVEIEVDGLVYGFEFKNKADIHLFPRMHRNNFNSKFTIKKKEDWLKETESDKITSIFIPIERDKKIPLINTLASYQKEIPYDYSFFGMRCTSAAYEIISELGVFPKKSRVRYIVTAFYPRQLRKKLIKWAKNNTLHVRLKEGIKCRTWD